jgi:arginine/ornithine N-succinyltransferase beta subunit
MLQKQEFALTNEIAFDDGGPKVFVPTAEIKAVKNSRTVVINAISQSSIAGTAMLISNESLDFRACQATATQVDGGLMITQEVADALAIVVGQQVRYLSDL